MKVVFLLAFSVLVKGDYSSVKLGLNEIALTEVFKAVENALTLIEIGNITLKADGLTFVLTNMVMNNTLAVKQESFLILEPCMIQINFTDLNSIITFNYSEVPVNLYSGKGTITFPDSFILLQLVFSVIDGAIQVDLTQDSNIVFGSAIIKSNLPKSINTALQNELNQVVFLIENTIMAEIEPYFATELNPVLYSIAKLIPIPPLKIMYNISLTDESLIEGTYLTLPLRGEFITYPYRTRFFPFLTTPLPSISESTFPFQILLSDYNFGLPLTMIWSQLDLNVTKLPKAIPLQLTTDGLAFILPGLKKQFGSDKPVIINVKPCFFWGVPLNFSIPNAVAELDLGIELNFYVVSNSQVDYALTLFQQIQLKFVFSELNFTANFEITSLNLLNNTLGPNNVAPVNILVLDKTLQLLTKTIVPLINSMGSNFVIKPPILPINFYETSITLIDHGLCLEAGFNVMQAVEYVRSSIRSFRFS